MMFGFSTNSSKQNRGKYETIPDHSSTQDDSPNIEIESSSNDNPMKVKRIHTFKFRGIAVILFWLLLVFLSLVVVTKQSTNRGMFHNRRSHTVTDLEDTIPILQHHETLPTFLSLMEMSTISTTTGTTPIASNSSNHFEYVYALDNPFYDLVTQHLPHFIGTGTREDSEEEEEEKDDYITTKQRHTTQIRIHWSMDPHNHEVQQHSSRDDHDDHDDRHSMLVQWESITDDNSNDDRVDPNDHDDDTEDAPPHDDTHDLLVLSCTSSSGGHDDDGDVTIFEVASLAQVRATHHQAMLHSQHWSPQHRPPWLSHNTNDSKKNVEFWYIPNVPSMLFRQSECYWDYYYYNGNDDEDNDMDVEATTLDVTQYIPMGTSNRYQMSTIQNNLQPTNIHMALTMQHDEMIIQFTTGGGSSSSSVAATNMAAAAMIGTPIVEYSEMKKHHSRQQPHVSWSKEVVTSSTTMRVSGTTDTYTASDLCQAPANVTGPGKFISPGNLHTVRLSNLQSNTMYTYRVGMETGQGVIWNSHSGTFQSAMPTAVSDDTSVSTAFTFLVYGDQGCPATGWDDGQSWMEGMANREVFLHASSTSVASTPVRMIHHVGDLSYAQGAAHIWDAWLDMIQPISMYVPIMVAVGNHEYDHMSGGGSGKDPSQYVTTDSGFMPVWGNFANDSGGECGVPTSKRFTMPAGSIDNDEKPELQNNGVFWYWYDYGLVRTIVVSSEHDLSEGSIQHVWLEHVLFNTNRTITPWVIVELHRPLYEMEEALFPNPQNIGIAMRYEFEDLLHDYKVDIVFSGHFHTYHRTYVSC